MFNVCATPNKRRIVRNQVMIYGHKLDRLMPGSSVVQALLQEIGKVGLGCFDGEFSPHDPDSGETGQLELRL